MKDDLFTAIIQYVSLHPSLTSFPLVSVAEIEDAEQKLQLRFPDILKNFYLQIGNGYAGPSCDIMGLPGGCCSDLGDIVETYSVLKAGQELEGNIWKNGTLPFCYWGCNIFSCVDCVDKENLISTFEDFALWPQKYSLETFFQWWISGVDILAQERVKITSTEIVNPFTQQKTVVHHRRRRANED